MKILFSSIFFIVAMLGILAGQDFFNLDEISAVQSKHNEKRKKHYEQIFQKTKFKTFKGKEFDLKSEKTPIVIINFWASWCRPCISEFASLKSLVKKYGEKNILVLAVNTDQENQVKAIKKITKKYKLDFPVVPDKKGSIVSKFLVENIPFSLIYVGGKLHKIEEGETDFMAISLTSELEKHIKPSKVAQPQKL